MAWFRCGGGSSKKSFTWKAQYLAGGINIENTGKIKLETITQNTGGTIGIFGTNSPDIITNDPRFGVTRIGDFNTTNVGNVYELEVDKKYSHIVLWSFYVSSGWEAFVRITT